MTFEKKPRGWGGPSLDFGLFWGSKLRTSRNCPKWAKLARIQPLEHPKMGQHRPKSSSRAQKWPRCKKWPKKAKKGLNPAWDLPSYNCLKIFQHQISHWELPKMGQIGQNPGNPRKWANTGPKEAQYGLRTPKT